MKLGGKRVNKFEHELKTDLDFFRDVISKDEALAFASGAQYVAVRYKILPVRELSYFRQRIADYIKAIYK